MRKKARSGRKPYDAMSPSELAEATAPYGQEMIIDQFTPLTETARRRWEQARRKPGRPRRGKGVKVISVSVEQDLLRRSDKLAHALGVSRARLIERGLRVVLAARQK
ncbi:MAG: hypothetical protein ACRD3M_15355 [Thermoanaerobaculia bacterium]